MPSRERRIESALAIEFLGYIPLHDREELFLDSAAGVFMEFLNGLTPAEIADYALASVDARSGGRVRLDFSTPKDEEVDEALPDLRELMLNAGDEAYLAVNNLAGGDDFAENLEMISLHGYHGVDLQIRNDILRDPTEEAPVGPTGDRFMSGLEDLVINSVSGDANAEFVNRGGRDFMENLEEIDIFGHHDARLRIESDSQGETLPSGELLNTQDFMSSLQSISVVAANGFADVSVSHDGASGFMEDLKSIYVQGDWGEDQSRGVLVEISASANEGGGSGASFMESLESIEILGTAGEADLSISHSGGTDFMESLQEIDVRTTGLAPTSNSWFGDLEVSISASANTHHSHVEKSELAGQGFMDALESISLVSEQTSASLSLSHSGSNDFMQSLTEIHIEAQMGNGMDDASAELSISASANTYNAYTYDDSLDQDVLIDGLDQTSFFGDNFMESLESISVIAADKDASMSISHSGGDDFMQGLKTLYVEARGLNDGSEFYGQAEISISASAQFRSYSGDFEPTQLRGNGFMESLESIQILSNANAQASLSISHSGGDDMMTDLKTIQVRNTYDGPVSYFDEWGYFNDWDQPGAVVDISASLNFSGAQGNNFMESLESIEVESAVGTATLSISAEGQEDFMSDLTMLHVVGTMGAAADIHQGANNRVWDRDLDEWVILEDAPTGSDFMQSLETIEVRSEMGRAALSIEHSAGGPGFMEDLTDLDIFGQAETRLNIHNHTSNGFMESLETINIERAEDPFFDNPVFLYGYAHGYGLNPEEPPFLVPQSSVNIINTDGDRDEEEEEEGGGLRKSGADFMESLEEISLASNFSGEINLMNGLHADRFFDGPEILAFIGPEEEDEPFLPSDMLLSELFHDIAFFGGLPFMGPEKPGGNDFMQSLETINLETGMDGDITLMSQGNRSFEALTDITIVSNENGFFGEGPLLPVFGPGLEEEELLDLFTSELTLYGMGDEDAFADLENISIDAGAPPFLIPAAAHVGPEPLDAPWDGPWGPFMPGNIAVELYGVQGNGFDVNLSTSFGGNILLAAVDTAGMGSITLSGDNIAEVILLGDQSDLELIDLTGMSESSLTLVSLGAHAGGPAPFLIEESEESDATLADEIDVLVGDGMIEFEAIGGSQENFIFADGGSGDLQVFGFEAGDDGDVLDFSDLNIDEDDLVIVDDGPGGVSITGTAGSDFEGEIQLIGIDVLDLSDDNFLF